MRQIAAALAVAQRPITPLDRERERRLALEERALRRTYVRRERARRLARRRAALARLAGGVVPQARGVTTR